MAEIKIKRFEFWCIDRWAYECRAVRKIKRFEFWCIDRWVFKRRAVRKNKMFEFVVFCAYFAECCISYS